MKSEFQLSILHCVQNKYLHPFGTITEQQQDAPKHNITVT